MCGKRDGPLGLFFGRVSVAQEALLHGEEGGGGSRGNADLLVDVFDMVMHGTLRDSEPCCHLTVGMAASDQPEHFDFAVREPCHPYAPG